MFITASTGFTHQRGVAYTQKGVWLMHEEGCGSHMQRGMDLHNYGLTQVVKHYHNTLLETNTTAEHRPK